MKLEEIKNKTNEAVSYLVAALESGQSEAYQEEKEWRVIQFGRVNLTDVIKAFFRTGGRALSLC